MKVAVILNGSSRKKKKFLTKILPALQQAFPVELHETTHRGHAIDLAERVSGTCEAVIAAGGDGSLNEVVNGVLRNPKGGTAVGIIPLGTGNDFVRMIGMNQDPTKLIALIQTQQFKSTDVAIINCFDENGSETSRYSINACSVGMGPEVVRRLMKSSRVLGPTLTYLKSIIPTFFSHKPQRIEISNNQWKWSGLIRVCAIANGQSFGNGIYIVPDTQPDNGIITTCIAGALPLWKFLWYLQKFKARKKIIDPKYIHYKEGQIFRISSNEPMWIESEGELAGCLPATVKLIPGAIQFVR